MSTSMTRLAVATAATIGLLAVATPLTPASAQVYFSDGPYGVMIAPPAPYYYGPYAYPHYYWHHPRYYYGW